MKVTRRSRWQVRLQNVLFVLLFLGVLAAIAWLSTRWSYEADWTAGQRNTLTEASRELVERIDGPVEVTAFVREGELGKRRFEEVIARYQRFKPDITLEFVNPDADPERVRRAGITTEGEVIVDYEGRSERLSVLSEQNLTNALQRLAREEERWIAFVEGHGERDPQGEANHDYGMFGAELERKGFRVQTVNPAAQGGIPDNTSLVVVTTPQAELVPAAAGILAGWVADGGNLLWLADPGPLQGLEPLAERLGIEFPHGAVVDTTAQMFGINDPTMIIVAEYASHPVTRDFSIITLFPHVTAVDYSNTPDDWEVGALLTTMPRSWLESGELAGNIAFDEDSDDRPGPLDIGITLTRAQQEGGEQRVAVTGDGDFLANAYLNNAGNLEFGLNLFNWLVHDEQQLNIHMRSAPDLTLTLSRNAFIGIGFGSLIVLPLLLVGTGVLVWWHRRRR